MSTTDTTLRRIRNTTATLAAGLFLGRCAVGLGLVHIPEAITFSALFPFVASLITTAATGYQLRISRILAEKQAAEERAIAAETRVVQLSQAALSEEDDRALWDSIPAATIDEDTCAFGVNVVALNQYRGYPQAG